MATLRPRELVCGCGKQLNNIEWLKTNLGGKIFADLCTHRTDLLAASNIHNVQNYGELCYVIQDLKQFITSGTTPETQATNTKVQALIYEIRKSKKQVIVLNASSTYKCIN